MKNCYGKELVVYNQLLLGLGAPDSVRCARTSLGEQSALGTRRRRTAINHRTVRWCTGLSGESSVAKSSLSGNVQWRTAKIHRTVRWCTGLSGEANDQLRHPTEGKNCLPRVPPTAPSCLGAIKGTPRRLEESPKHTLGILIFHTPSPRT
jgi:hypothetical protein